MLPAGLTEVEVADYLTTLTGSYEWITKVVVLDNERNTISTVPAGVLGGQVDCTRVGQRAAERAIEREDEPEAAVSRIAKGVTLLDPDHAVAIDSSSPADGALFLDRMIQIICSIRGRLRWYDIPVFTGPITLVDRDGPIITLEAHSMEEFGLSAAFNTGEVRDKYKRAAFLNLLGRMGEDLAYVDVPDNDEKLNSSIPIARDTRLWDKAFYVAAGLGRYCYYDGSGFLRTPRWTSAPAIAFAGGTFGLLLSEPQVSYRTDEFKNAWWVKTTTSGGKDIEATVVLPSSHPLSPAKLGRNGKPRYLLGVEEDGDLRTEPKARARAQFRLEHSALSARAQFEARPVFHLNPFDWMRVTVPEWSMDVPIGEFSLPIVPGSPMTVGYQRELSSPGVAQIRKV